MKTNVRILAIDRRQVSLNEKAKRILSVCDDLFEHTYQMRGNGGPESVLSGHSKKENQNMVFKTDYGKMHVKSIAECFWSILQYFQPSLSYNLSLRSLFCCLFLSGYSRHVLLYRYIK